MERFEYSCARDFFEAARAASLDAERIGRRIKRMEGSEGPRAQGYDAQGRGSRRDVNGTAAVVARMDYEARVERRLDADYALIDRACSVIYGDGQTGLGGIDALMGAPAADAVWWRFCAAATWERVAREVEQSVRWCQYTVGRALDECDAYGMWGMMRGLGVACAG